MTNLEIPSRYREILFAVKMLRQSTVLAEPFLVMMRENVIAQYDIPNFVRVI